MYQYATVCAVLAVLIYALSWLFSRTDIPKIKGLPELPSVPIFGSLFFLGKHHAKKCAALVDTYGEVFQVKLGNRVSHYNRSHGG
jgi:phenylacetate 2-hydroxylase